MMNAQLQDPPFLLNPTSDHTAKSSLDAATRTHGLMLVSTASIGIPGLWLGLSVVSGSSWARFWTGVVIVPRGTSMVWTLLRRLLLRFARVDILVSGAGLVIDGAISGFWG